MEQKKNIFITGSTDGVGKLAAIDFAKDGHTVYIHGRSQQKVDVTIQEIKDVTSNENIQGFVADLSDLNEVQKMSDEIIEKVSSIDVFINNAGVFKSPNNLCPQGFDLRYTVNYLAPYLLTNNLIQLFDKATQARIINLSSAAQSSINLDAMLGKQAVGVSDAYAQSKLAITMWSFYFAKKHPNYTVIAVNPGSLLNTKMANEAYGQYWSSANKGSDIIVQLSLDETHKNKTAQYFDNDSGSYALAHSDAYKPELINKLIENTEQLI